jgi:hypothetical protein
MIEGALTSLMNGILSGAALTSAGKKTDKKEDKQLTEPRLKKKASVASDEGQKLTKEEKDELEYLLVAGGLSTKQAKEALSGEPVPRKWFMDFDKDTLKQIADITGAYDYSNFIYDGDKIGKGMTVIPLTKRNKPNTETMPLGEAKGKKTTIEGEEAKDKKTVMKGEEAKNKSTVMEIPEEDLSRLIEVAKYNLDADEVIETAMRLKMPLKQLQEILKAELNKKHQKALEDDLQKQAQKDGRIEHDNKIKDPKFKKATEEAAEKYKKETPDYKYDDVKRKNEAKGEQYTTERHSGEPSKEEVDKADDFVMKNAGRDYEARLDRAKNYTSIYRPGK